MPLTVLILIDIINSFDSDCWTEIFFAFLVFYYSKYGFLEDLLTGITRFSGGVLVLTYKQRWVKLPREVVLL